MYTYIPRYRIEENFIIASKSDGKVDIYSHDALNLLKNGCFELIEPYKLFDLDNILKLKKERKLTKFFDDDYLNKKCPLKSPISLSIEVTRQCNLSCKHCSIKAGIPRNNELTLNEILSIIDQAKEMEVMSLFITGGEPLLRKDIVEILNYIASKDIDCFIQTNGLLITKKLLDNIPKSIYFVISFDGLEHCGKLHASNKDFRFYEGLFKLLRSEKRNFSIQYVAYHDNLEDLPNTYQYCKDNKIDLAALDLFCTGRANLNRDLFPTQDDWPKLERLAESKYEYEKAQQEFEKTIFINAPNAYHFAFIQKLQEIFERTYSGVFAMYISSDGTAYPDVMHAGENMFAGGSVRENKIKDIWDNSFSDIRELVQWKQWSHCKNCPLNVQFCDYKMPVLSYNIYKKYNYCGALPSQVDIMNKRYTKRESTRNVFDNDKAREIDFW